MTFLDYTYSVLSYRPDVTSGESLNVGVVLACAEAEWADARWEDDASRLRRAFREFHPDLHREVGHGVKRAFRAMRANADRGQTYLFKLPDAAGLMREIWPDTGLAYRASPVRTGRTENLDRALDGLFDLFVRSQAPERAPARPRRTREDVWRKAAVDLSPAVRERLRPETSVAAGFPFAFEHAYRNGVLHVVEPVTFDLEDPARLRDRALHWHGAREILRDEVGSLALVVAPPTGGDELARAFGAARELLLSGGVALYDEHETDRLDARLTELMRL